MRQEFPFPGLFKQTKPPLSEYPACICVIKSVSMTIHPGSHGDDVREVRREFILPGKPYSELTPETQEKFLQLLTSKTSVEYYENCCKWMRMPEGDAKKREIESHLSPSCTIPQKTADRLAEQLLNHDKATNEAAINEAYEAHIKKREEAHKKFMRKNKPDEAPASEYDACPVPK